MAEEGLATQRGAARARVSAKGCIGVKEERRREWEKWRKRKKRGGREREREREREGEPVWDERYERGRRSIIVINTITINAPETAVRSRESAWIPFTPLLSRPSFSGYITTSGNPLFGKFFGFSRRIYARAFSRFVSFRECLRAVLSSSVPRARAAYIRVHRENTDVRCYLR